MSRQDGSHRRVSDASVDDGTAHILHIDMDAFFASVELLERPDLHGLPVIVAHDGPRSIITTATYEARRYGIHSAMPLARARQLCPRAVLIEPHFERYRTASATVMQVLQRFTPLVEQVSVDEAYLDVRGAQRLFGSAGQIAERIRGEVFAATGLHCSVGVATSKFVAKLASGMAKPDGMLIVPAGQTLAFLAPLEVGALPGVGGRTAEKLQRLGLMTVADLAQAPEQVLLRAVGVAQGTRLRELAHGRDGRPVSPGRVEKSIGHERTFDDDIDAATNEGRDRLRSAVLDLAERTCARARRHHTVARTVAIRVRDAAFHTVTRSQTLREPTQTGRTVFETAWRLFDESGMVNSAIRLIGVRLEQLAPVGADGAETALWSDDDQWRVTDQAVDAVVDRFGPGAVRPARLMRREGPTADH